MNIIKTPYFPSKESFESYKNSPEYQHWWYEKYLSWVARCNIIIGCGGVSMMWLVYYFPPVDNNLNFRTFICSFSLVYATAMMILPLIFKKYEPKWVNDYKEKIKSKI